MVVGKDLIILWVSMVTYLLSVSEGQWDCFNRRTWEYNGTYHYGCMLTGSALDCNRCENWTSVLGNQSEILEQNNLQDNHCRIMQNTTAPWCYFTDMNGDVRPSVCRVEPCRAHAGCRSNDTGEDYRGFAEYTESGYRCLYWNETYNEDVNDITFPDSDLEQNFCRNPDGRDRPWCYYRPPWSSEILWDYCQIDVCETDSLQAFHHLPSTRFFHYENRAIGNANITAEKCAIACLRERSFVCRSFKYRDVYTYNDRVCLLSAESIYTLNGARRLPQLYSADTDTFTRIDKICDAFQPDMKQMPAHAQCPLPITTVVSTGRLNATYSASSHIEGHPPDQADVEGGINWIPSASTTDEWWQVCYSERVIVTGLVTRGSGHTLQLAGCWVDSFRVDYSLDGERWWNLLDYTSPDKKRKLTFLANSESTCNATSFMPSPLRAKCLRVLPQVWQEQICLSVTVLGCLDNDCDEVVGVSLDGIHDNQITASSWSDEDHTPRAGRVGFLTQRAYGWMASGVSTAEWIQIDFGPVNVKRIHGVITQGCLDREAWVKAYTISYLDTTDPEKGALTPYRDSNGRRRFIGNRDRMTLWRQTLDPPIVTPRIRLNPVAWHGSICLRTEFTGCQNLVCNQRNGLESREKIPDEAMSASTFYYATPGFNGRLHLERNEGTPSPHGFWGARGTFARNEWLQVDLPELYTITAVITQGPGDQNVVRWVTAYRLAYWSVRAMNESDDNAWLFYRDVEGRQMILEGNSDHNTESRTNLDRPIVTRKVRIMPYEWYGPKIVIRAELVGCPLRGTGNVCRRGKSFLHSGHCYSSVSSNEASACQDIFAEESSRALIKSSALKAELLSRQKDLVFLAKTQLVIGATKAGDDVPFVWDDGTPMIYQDFLVDPPEKSGVELCAAVDGMANFRWMPFECDSTILRGTLCELDMNECLRSDTGCSNDCANVPGGYYCRCPRGSRLDSTKHNCMDICNDNIATPQNSTITQSAYSCFYVIDSDAFTWSEATNQCLEILGHLPNIDDLVTLQILADANDVRLISRDDPEVLVTLPSQDGSCHSIRRNTSDLTDTIDDCGAVTKFVCEVEFADLRCHGSWSEGVADHVTSASFGHLQAMSYPPWYNQLSSCRFHVNGPKGLYVRLHISWLSLRMTNDIACLDTLDIEDVISLGNRTAFHQRGGYCGNIQDVEIIGKSNAMRLELRMDELTVDMPFELGFEARYDMVDCKQIDCNKACGSGHKTFNDTSGYFSTKDFPSAIPPFTSCQWKVSAGEGRFVELQFPAFNIMQFPNNEECVDEVSVWTHEGAVKESMCGHEAPPFFISNSSIVVVSLDTGLAGMSQGFNASYRTTDIGGCGFGRDTCARDTNDEFCTLPSAVFVSVNYPYPYEANSRCLWYIRTPEGSFVTITFLNFSVWSHVEDTDCQDSDYVVIFDGWDTKEPDMTQLGRFCNGMPPPSAVRSSSNTVTVKFRSNDDGMEGQGFYAEYRSSYTELDIEVSPNGKRLQKKYGYACPDGWEEFRGNCYRFTSLNQTLRWNDASLACDEEGAHLVSIKDSVEMSYIHYMLTSSWFTGNDEKTYIGLTDAAREGHFRWMDGSPLSYADWFFDTVSLDMSQPNGGEQEDCTMIYQQSLLSSANWHDIACASLQARQYICKQGAKGELVWVARLRRAATSKLAAELVIGGTDDTGRTIAGLGTVVGSLEGMAGVGMNGWPSTGTEMSQSSSRFSGELNRVTLSIGDLIIEECPQESVRVGDLCLWLREHTGSPLPSTSCPPLPASHTLHVRRVRATVGLLWPGGDEEFGVRINLQGVYSGENETLQSPSSGGAWNGPCHVMTYVDDDWQVVSESCSPEYNGSVCYQVVSESLSYCPEDMFVCPNGECIQSVYVCDAHADCLDGADERSCSNSVSGTVESETRSCSPSSFTCETGECISVSFYCDFIQHCPDGSDEADCSYPSCEEDEFECANGQCIPIEKQCDIVQDCVDGSDEDRCQFCSEGFFQCYDGTCIPHKAVCDGFKDCQGLTMEDELMCDDGNEDETTRGLECLNSDRVDTRWRCLYDFDAYGIQQGCRDVTHLRDCADFDCVGNTFKCPESYCLPLRRRCDGIVDCPGGEDESSCESFSCPGFLKCHLARYCVTRSQLCDGIADCPDGDDEMFCDVSCPSGCTCDGFNFECSSVGAWTPELAAEISPNSRQIVINNVARGSRRKRRDSAPTSNQTTIEDAVYLNMSNYKLLLSLHLSGDGIELVMPGTFAHSLNLMTLDLSRNEISVLHRDTFSGLSRLTSLDLSSNPLVTIEPQAFVSLSSLPQMNLQYLRLSALKAGAFVGLQSVELLNLTGNDIRNIESGAFEGLVKTHTLILDGNDVLNFDLDIFEDLTSLQTLSSELFLFCCIVPDIEDCSPPEDEFSSCKDLMRSDVLRAFMWILGFSALIGNAFVIGWRLKSREKFRVQSFLIFNLALSDCLMGMYMIVIASADAHYRDVYVYHAEAWRSGGMCKLAGILANLSSEASVLILTVISVDRFLCVTFPFSEYHLGRKSVRYVAGVVWLVALILSAIPALPSSYFRDEFYGRSGVCLALPLTNTRPPGWEYATGLFVGLNFVALLTIIVCYAAIYSTAKRSTMAIRNSRKMSVEMKLAMRTVVIVATDMCCWLPIVVMAFLALTNAAVIPPSVYAWTAVFILPINSSINPYLYTISAIDVRAKVKSFRGTFMSTISSGNGNHNSTDVSLLRRDMSLNGARVEKQNSASPRKTKQDAPIRLFLSEAIRLVKAKKLTLDASDVSTITTDLHRMLEVFNSCSIGYIVSADNIIIEKNEKTCKWKGSLLLSCDSAPSDNDQDKANCFDHLELVIAELNDALGLGTTV
ncbi:uncharacterized protein [Diadema antillarum]|uniref:uncharacterized protein n=1 Tax=Diadema antillarum TaxID=105358 RepID=UPI003A858829